MIYKIHSAEFSYGPSVYPVTPYNLKQLPQAIEVLDGNMRLDEARKIHQVMCKLSGGHQLNFGTFQTYDFRELEPIDWYDGPIYMAAITGNGWCVRFVSVLDRTQKTLNN